MNAGFLIGGRHPGESFGANPQQIDGHHFQWIYPLKSSGHRLECDGEPEGLHQFNGTCFVSPGTNPIHVVCKSGIPVMTNRPAARQKEWDTLSREALVK